MTEANPKVQSHHRSLADEVLGYWYELGRWGISDELRNMLTESYQRTLMADATSSLESIILRVGQ